jgi:hypothetical protein
MPLHRSLSCLMLTALLSSCSGGAGGDRLPTHEVTGKVTLGGAPIADAAIIFSPVKEGQPVALARTDSQGAYSLTTYEAGDGAVAGDYVVLVSKGGGDSAQTATTSHEAYAARQTVTMHKPGGRGASAGGSGSSSALPSKYANVQTSDLRVTVKEESNQIDLPLSP